jgi:hypothetical protein
MHAVDTLLTHATGPSIRPVLRRLTRGDLPRGRFGLASTRALVTLALGAGFVAAGAAGWFGTTQDDRTWTREFAIEPGGLGPTGRNPYFILEPHYRLVLANGQDRLVITVLDETRPVDGVETRVVEERETEAGALIEVSRNFYAISRRTNSVFYFGEEVDMYRDGRVTGHEGAWRSGAAGARFGLMMPGVPLLRGRYYQEIAPGVALDRAEIVSTGDTLTTPAGVFRQVLRTDETTPLERGARESKRYAPGIGLIQDGSLKLVSYGPAGRD